MVQKASHRSSSSSSSLTCSLIFIHSSICSFRHMSPYLSSLLPHFFLPICSPLSSLSVFPHPYPPSSHSLSFRSIYFVPPASAPCFTPGVDYFACICFSLLSSSSPLFFISCSWIPRCLKTCTRTHTAVSFANQVICCKLGTHLPMCVMLGIIHLASTSVYHFLLYLWGPHAHTEILFDPLGDDYLVFSGIVCILQDN